MHCPLQIASTGKDLRIQPLPVNLSFARECPSAGGANPFDVEPYICNGHHGRRRREVHSMSRLRALNLFYLMKCPRRFAEALSTHSTASYRPLLLSFLL
ncbi:hypothetical protein Ddc_08802 [Ditylenchus destructor]|nr:hypothetical protein Ddc_08802 [Ditylenchus destructor]